MTPGQPVALKWDTRCFCYSIFLKEKGEEEGGKGQHPCWYRENTRVTLGTPVSVLRLLLHSHQKCSRWRESSPSLLHSLSQELPNWASSPLILWLSEYNKNDLLCAEITVFTRCNLHFPNGLLICKQTQVKRAGVCRPISSRSAPPAVWNHPLASMQQ